MAAHGEGDYYDSDCSNEEEWEEHLDEDFNPQTSKCLFCDKQFHTADEIYNHCKKEHSFDIHKIKIKFSLDCFDYIRLINFLRLEKPKIDSINSLNEELWRDEKFMKPILNDDLLLTFDIESCESESEDIENDEKVILSRKEYKDLMKQLKILESNNSATQEQLNDALSNIDKLRTLAQKYFLEDNNTIIESKESTSDVDQSYFDGYSHFGIHHEMLSDKIRTESYRDAIMKNPKTFNNKTVLDVGCGTGILSLFAVKAGAAKCYAVDQSDIIYHAIDIVRENQLHDKIILIKNKMEDIELEVEKVDIIISEWMGYFLFYECMLDTIIYARDKYLKPDGHILPNRCTLSIAGVNDDAMHNEVVGFWDDVYGFKMSCMKKETIKEASVEYVDAKAIITTIATIADVDIRTCDRNSLEFTTPFSLTMQKTGKLIAFVAYFDVHFELDNPVFFSTSPSSKSTHWKQTVFYLEEPLHKTKGDVMSGTIICNRHKDGSRGLLVNIEFEGKTYRYIIE